MIERFDINNYISLSIMKIKTQVMCIVLTSINMLKIRYYTVQMRKVTNIWFTTEGVAPVAIKNEIKINKNKFYIIYLFEVTPFYFLQNAI